MILLIYVGGFIVDSLNWCLRQNKGIRLVEPNLGIAKKYLAESKLDLTLIDRNEPKWNIIKEYYVCYNSLYSLLVKCGIKCEIHDCTIKLMDIFGFDSKIQDGLVDLKKERIGVQYYLGDSEKDYFNFAREFFESCEVKFIELNDFDVRDIRGKLKRLNKNEK